MAKQRKRREMAAAKPSDHYHDQTPRRSLKLSSIVAGITVCLVFAVYFAFSAPTPKKNVARSEDLNKNWHLDKRTWMVEHLNDKEFRLVCDAVQIERMKNEYLRNFMVVRTPGSKNIIKVKNFIRSTLEDLSYEVEEDTFEDGPPASYSKKPVRFTNIIATRNPFAKRRLVLACHYDSKVTPKGFLGATDSAAPCAMILEIAKALDTYLSLAPKDSDVTLQLIFFDGEEAFVQWTSHDSIYGARHLAQRWQEQRWPPGSEGTTKMLDSIDLLMLLDLLGEENPSFYDIVGVHKTGHYKELVRIEKRIQYDSTQLFNERKVNSHIEDDHIPFLRRNVPILHIIPQPFPKNWHKITDNGENLHDPTMDKLTKIFAVFIAEYLHLKPIAF